MSSIAKRNESRVFDVLVKSLRTAAREIALIAILLLAGSTGRAQEWVPIGPSGEHVASVAASRGIVIAGTGTAAPCESFCLGDGIFRSEDGLSWTNVLLSSAIPPGRIPAVASDARDPNVMYAGAGSSPVPGMWKSADSGRSWSLLPLSVDVASIRTTAEPAPAGTVWVAAAEGLFRSRDQGFHWTKLTSGRATLVAPAPSDPSIVYASDSSLGSSALFKSRDGGETWSAVPALGGLSAIGLASVRSAAVDPADPDRIYAFTQQLFFGAPAAEFSRLWTSVDGGLTWRDTGIRGSGPLLAPEPLVVYASAYPDSIAFIGQAPPPGFYWSGNGGMDWTHLEGGLPTLVLADLANDSSDPATIHAATSQGVFRLRNPAPADSSLIGGRFSVSLVWLDRSSTPAAAHPMRLSDNAVAFWFFTPNNIELVLKIMDGRAVNASFWVFAGSLTDVAYDVSVTDGATGRVWQRHKEAGALESFADTRAF